MILAARSSVDQYPGRSDGASSGLREALKAAVKGLEASLTGRSSVKIPSDCSMQQSPDACWSADFPPGELADALGESYETPRETRANSVPKGRPRRNGAVHDDLRCASREVSLTTGPDACRPADRTLISAAWRCSGTPNLPALSGLWIAGFIRPATARAAGQCCIRWAREGSSRAGVPVTRRLSPSRGRRGDRPGRRTPENPRRR